MRFLYILTLESNHDILLQNVRAFLKSTGADLLETSITIQTSRSGFAFLDWYFRVTKTGRVISYPNKSNLNRQKKKIQAILKNNQYSIETRIDNLRVIVQEWYFYHKLCDFSQIKSQFIM